MAESSSVCRIISAAAASFTASVMSAPRATSCLPRAYLANAAASVRITEHREQGASRVHPPRGQVRLALVTRAMATNRTLTVMIQKIVEFGFSVCVEPLILEFIRLDCAVWLGRRKSDEVRSSRRCFRQRARLEWPLLNCSRTSLLPTSILPGNQLVEADGERQWIGPDASDNRPPCKVQARVLGRPGSARGKTM